MKDVAFGQYYPVASPIHRLDPRVKILMSIAYIVAVFFCTTYTSFFALFVFLFAVSLISHVPFRKLLRSIRPLLFIVAFTLIINLFFNSGNPGPIEINLYFHKWTVENQIWAGWWKMSLYWTGIDFALKMMLRLTMLVMGPAVLTFTTTPIELTDAIESLLKPLTWVRFPVHSLAMIMSIALRMIPTIMEETDKIILAQKARCADFDSRNIFKKARALLPILIPLFVSNLRRADELSNAMDSRCYRGAKGRTKMKRLKFHWRDLIAFLIFAALFFFILLLKYNFFGWAWILAVV